MQGLPEYDTKSEFLESIKLALSSEMSRVKMFEEDTKGLQKFIEAGLKHQASSFQDVPFYELQDMLKYLTNDPSKNLAEEECNSAYDLSQRISR